MAANVHQVDVLIIGAGPAGLAAANCFKSANHLRVRLIDEKHGPTQTGRADGLKSISLEVFDTFGIGDAVRNESHRVEEITLWEPRSGGGLARSMTIPDRIPDLGKPREVTLDQGCIEDIMIQSLRQDGNVKICWMKTPTDLRIDLGEVEHQSTYPVTVSLRSSAVSKDVPSETIQARYLIACDGAHSWTRKQLKIALVGDPTDSIWGVMDIVPKTNFPDIRKVCVVHSAKGTLMGVPRENKLVRFYVAMDGLDFDVGAALNERTLLLDHVMDAARPIMAPYTFEAGRVAWWSAYKVGQRVADVFSLHGRVFLAGDAVHTHSPKAGQGMNTSIQDAYNIGWKLRFLLEQRASRSLLATYDRERRPVAQELIRFDREYLRYFSMRNMDTNSFLDAYITGMRFTTGLDIQYPPSLLVQNAPAAAKGAAHLAKQLSVGMRLPDFQMVNQADGVPITIYHRLVLNGQFRLLVFAGCISKESVFKKLLRLGGWLEDFNRHHSGAETIVIHAARRADVELADLPDVFHPWDQDDGYNYWRVYVDDESYHDGHGQVYRRCGIERQHGCVVVVRPDGYISLICELDQTDSITAFFDHLR